MKRRRTALEIVRKYGLSAKSYNELLRKQGGKCAICQEVMKPPCVDHNHETGEIRGLLCKSCNWSLGAWENNRPKFEGYLDTLRPSRDKLYMGIAFKFSSRSTCPRRHVGCVIVNHNRIIAHGYNGAPSLAPHCEDVGCKLDGAGSCIRAAHAEQNALGFAARHGIAPVEGSSLFSTDAPCADCAKGLITAGVIRVTYEHPYRLTDGLTLLQEAGVQIGKWIP